MPDRVPEAVEVAGGKLSQQSVSLTKALIGRGQYLILLAVENGQTSE
jgi:hypothetical protein